MIVLIPAKAFYRWPGALAPRRHRLGVADCRCASGKRYLVVDPDALLAAVTTFRVLRRDGLIRRFANVLAASVF